MLAPSTQPSRCHRLGFEKAFLSYLIAPCPGHLSVAWERGLAPTRDPATADTSQLRGLDRPQLDYFLLIPYWANGHSSLHSRKLGLFEDLFKAQDKD